MAYLFEVEGKTVIPNTETLMIEPFKSIWNRDKTKTKTNALEELTYIEFMSSHKQTNPYRQYDESKKSDKIIGDIITQINWKPDELVLKAIKKIEDFQENASTTYSFFKAGKVAIEKVKKFLLEFDLDERNDKGIPIYKASDIQRNLEQLQKTTISFKALEKTMQQELFEATKTKGGKTISPFAKKSSLDKR